MSKYALRFGLIGGLIIGLFMSITFLVGKGENKPSNSVAEIIGYAVMLIGLSMIFVGIKSYRDKARGGTITFGNAFLMGLYITAVASALYCIWWMIFYAAGPGQDLITEYAEEARKGILQSAPSEEEAAKEIQEMESWMELYARNGFVRFAFTLMEIFPLGLVVSLISAAILRRKPRV